MYLKKDNIKMIPEENARGGKGTVYKSCFLEKKHMKDSCRLFGKLVIPPGCSFGYHIHENEGEAYHIISGTGLYNDNGNKYSVFAGDTTFTPDGSGHGIENTGEEDLVVLAVILTY